MDWGDRTNCGVGSFFSSFALDFVLFSCILLPILFIALAETKIANKTHEKKMEKCQHMEATVLNFFSVSIVEELWFAIWQSCEVKPSSYVTSRLPTRMAHILRSMLRVTLL